ncbi:hypothetical protein FRB95_007693 [Tulasnella sp. JGI-2019a]|nr:hypothetical protein FRB95_007693 [Tulasnella sp. JGI-2019a]
MPTTRPAPGDNPYRIHLAGSATCLGLDSAYRVILDEFVEDRASQKWFIQFDDSTDTFTARNASGNQRLVVTSDGSMIGSLAEKATVWFITVHTGPFSYSTISKNGSTTDHVIDTADGTAHLLQAISPEPAPRQRYIFEPATATDPAPVSCTNPKNATKFERTFFNLTVDKAKAMGPYDIIVVGTGIGGGVLARDLYETNSRLGDKAKSILVIEKGGLVFHSHCLNTSRPEGLGNNRGQQNDTFFAVFKEDYNIELQDSTEPLVHPSTWKGGPMHCVGGRSAAWGLFAPRVHDKTLNSWFPETVERDLIDIYFEEAEKLFNLSLPATRIIHQQVMERLNITAKDAFHVHWQWGRIASEFKDSKNFDFAEGAYSTIDKLLEIMMSKPPIASDPKSNVRDEHKNFKMLIGTEVRKILLDDTTKVATGVVVRPANGGAEEMIELKKGGTVILAAGSVASPAILLRSGVELGKEAGHITDHDILYRALSFRYRSPGDREDVGAMKLQTYFDMDFEGRFGLANMSIDASSFLPRSKTADKNLPQMIMAFILPCALESSCSITLEGDEPKVVMIRTQEYSEGERQKYLKRMEDITKSAIETIESQLDVELVNEKDRDGEYLSYLELGGVAHELGTLPMPNRKGDGGNSIDENLKLKGHDNVYICDLSIFPMSPEANPTLTLAALSLRLSRQLVPREKFPPSGAETIRVVNHSGEPIKVLVSNFGSDIAPLEIDPTVLLEGDDFSVERQSGVPQSVMVFRMDKLKKAKNGEEKVEKVEKVEEKAENEEEKVKNKEKEEKEKREKRKKDVIFSNEPELFVASPGCHKPVIVL